MLSTVWNSQKSPQIYIEKRSGRKDIEVTRRRRGGVKRREADLASNQFPKCSAQPGITKEVQSWVEKRRGREEIEVTWGRKRSEKRERAIKLVITVLSKNLY